jgi:phosphatidylglycerophosphatase A
MTYNVKRWLVTGGGLGFAPVASGSVGALAAIPLFLACRQLGESLYLVSMGILLIGACAGMVWAGSWVEGVYGKDPGEAVLDEIAGLLLTFLIYHRGATWQIVLWGYLASRFFDIIKIPPARQMERIRGGWGILLDDLISSAYAGVALHLAHRIAPDIGLGSWMDV